MCRPAKCACGIILLALLPMVGCQRVNLQKLNVEKSVSLTSGDVKSVTVDAPADDQKVAVTWTSSASPVSVYVVLQKD